MAGPWGAFAVVDVAAGDELRAILLAPWEGRPDPSPAELNLFGLLGIIIALLQDPEISNRVPHWLTSALGLPWRADLFAFGPKLMGPLATSNLFGVFMFALLAASLFYFARKKLD